MSNKRKLSASTPSQPPPKKRSLVGNGGPALATLGYGVTFGAGGEKSEIELLQYQNKSLSTLLKEKKDEISSLRTKLRASETREREANNGLAFVTQHWNSLDENLKTLLGILAPSTIKKENFQESPAPPPGEERSFLQLLLGEESDFVKGTAELKEKERGEEEEEQLDEEEAQARDEEYQKLRLKQRIEPDLERRSSFTRHILESICQMFVKQKIANDELAKLLQGSAGPETAAAEENKTLREKVSSLEKLVANLQRKNNQLCSESSEAKAGWIQAERKIKELSMDLEDAKADLSVCFNRMERLNKALQEAQTKAANAVANAALATASTQSSASSPSLVSPTEAASEEVQKLREELLDARTVDENRMKEIQKLRQDRTEMKKEIQDINEKLLNLPEHLVRASPPFRMLEANLHMTVMDCESHRSLCTQLQRSVAALEQEKREERERLQKNELARRQELEKDIKEKDAALARIRGERDNLIYRLEQKKASLPSQEIINEFKVTIAGLQDHNTRLRREIEAFKKEKERYNEGSSERPEVAELQEKIRTLQKGAEEMKRKYEDAQKELRSITESLPREQRELHEVRRNERKLADENNYLKAKLNKYEPKNKQSTSSSSSSSASSSSSHQSDKEKDYPRLLAKADQTIRDLQRSLDELKAENTSYLTEVDEIAKDYDSATEQNTRLLHQLSDKDETTTKLMSDRIKSEQLQNQLREELKLLQSKIKLANERYEQKQELFRQEESKVKMMEEQLSKASEQVSSFSNLIEAHKKMSKEAAQQSAEYKIKLDQASAALADYKKKLNEQSNDLERGEDKMARLMEERTVLKRKVERLSTRGSVDTLLEEEVNTLRKMLRCPVCNDNMKDTVITRCFHVFCNPCVRSRLQLRNRKCPGCAKAFGDSDVHSIYLGFDDVKEDEA